jgi:hypothetical protein
MGGQGAYNNSGGCAMEAIPKGALLLSPVVGTGIVLFRWQFCFL